MRSLVFLLSLLLIMSCETNSTLEIDCKKQMLKDNNLKAFKGTRTEGVYLMMKEYEGSQYFVWGNDLADFVMIVLDCEGTVICDLDNHSDLCEGIFVNGTWEIIGYQ